MSAMQHTPGPWRVKSSIYQHMSAEIVADRGVAQVWKGPNAMGDARLIAAAPDLLAELKRTVKRLVTCAMMQGNSEEIAEIAVADARAAIAKAETP